MCSRKTGTIVLGKRSTFQGQRKTNPKEVRRDKFKREKEKEMKYLSRETSGLILER